MTFQLISTFGVLLGITLLAIGLWLLQRLRVQHREVIVLSTLFWQSAIEETRARVFVKRFRHWPAWALLLTIASLMWILLAGPHAASFDTTQHVVLLDRSVDDSQSRDEDFRLAVDRASSLPTMNRELIAVGNGLQTLLAAGEPTELASLRIDDDAKPSPQGIQWAIQSLCSRASEKRPLSIHIVGSARVEQRFLDSISPNVSLFTVERSATTNSIRLTTLGVAESAAQPWNQVDVSFGFATDQEVEADAISVSLNDQTISLPIQKIGPSSFQVENVPAEGQQLRVRYNRTQIGSLTMPNRQAIRVSLGADVPEALRDLIQLDSACQIVSSDADVRVGAESDANLRLSMDNEPAFLIESDREDPNASLAELIDTLALRQIDATAIADQSGSVIDVQVRSSDKRSIAVWQKLFTASYDFRESRACPILIARSIRWIANHPPIIPWAEQGERLPVAAPILDRAIEPIALTNDGREIQTTRLASIVNNPAQLSVSPTTGLLSRIGLPTWLGLLVSLLLVGEWVLYQRGRLP